MLATGNSDAAAGQGVASRSLKKAEDANIEHEKAMHQANMVAEQLREECMGQQVRQYCDLVYVTWDTMTSRIPNRCVLSSLRTCLCTAHRADGKLGLEDGVETCVFAASSAHCIADA